MTKLKWYLIAAYTVFLIGSFFYVKQVLAGGSISVDTEEKEKGEKTRFVDVTLSIESGKQPTSVKTKLKNTNSVEDMLYELRKDKIVFYEVTTYTYGTELDMINHVKAPEGYKWRLFQDNKDITHSYSQILLENDEKYVLKLVKN
jgi:hypothetical protein